jgi:lipid A 3-O-deacylase
MLSARRINGRREFSTRFQFGEFIGAGVLFGPRRELGVGVRLQHVSNGGIRNPNPGLTFVSVVGRYDF